MRFFMTVTPPADYVQGRATPPAALMQAMGPHMEEAVKSGALISTAGLKPPAEGTLVRAQGGRIAVVDGPFAESKELIGGYAVMEAPSMAAAIELARSFVNLHVENGMPDVEVHIRAIDGGYNI